MEADAVLHAEAGRLDEAIDELNKCINVCGDYASAYNNRYAVLRAGRLVESMVRTSACFVVVRACQNSMHFFFSFLGPPHLWEFSRRAQAYRLKGENDKAKDDLDKAILLAGGDKAVLNKAYTQRGALHKALGNEDTALADLEKGAEYGNPIASGAAVSMNPYAKLCNAIVSEVMEAELRKGLGKDKAEQ
ncbi:MAG: hypothetical protein BJ554DRAFT_4114 [Olpidium bornovanus]|uniref:Uncharacterized protein n=1 Tax=Olpidium bornovanus TaxID=278681 RepID=A0A8H8A0B0_9FUNG|nr:MAG: hypothetical protein BJ554DRAFT_4114 [Olpidium bornovanus]